MGLSLNDAMRFNGVHESYKIAEEDASSPAYYGYVRPDGDWYIMKESVSGNVTSYRFTKGSGAVSSFATNWTNRASLTYDLYNAVFGI